jgi:hypothetical protein
MMICSKQPLPYVALGVGHEKKIFLSVSFNILYDTTHDDNHDLQLTTLNLFLSRCVNANE